jgi:hypothetical protein
MDPTIDEFGSPSSGSGALTAGATPGRPGSAPCWAGLALMNFYCCSKFCRAKCPFSGRVHILAGNTAPYRCARKKNRLGAKRRTSRASFSHSIFGRVIWGALMGPVAVVPDLMNAIQSRHPRDGRDRQHKYPPFSREWRYVAARAAANPAGSDGRPASQISWILLGFIIWRGTSFGRQ